MNDRLISENLILSLFDGKVEQEAPIFSKTMTKIIKGLPSAEPSYEQVKEYCRRRGLVLVEGEFMAHIIKGAPQAYIYKGMTNEEVIKTVFPKAVLHTEYDDVYLSFQQGVYLQDKDTTWLNAPYKGEDG